ncbi:MAG: hypothetical protein B6I20_13930 [Bacteroidetes bacterium 4572_117]|nr:MAG: hypothetical protein B6I20_13930 [Bacteroidetes bacterium 4572_117]
MRQKYLLFIIVCFLTINTNGQNSHTGIKLGYNSSCVIGNNISGVSNMPGLNIGGFFSYKFSWFYLQPELLISTKGFKTQSVGELYLGNIFIYTEMPILFKKHFLKQKKITPYLIAGPSFMFKVLAINLVSELEGIKIFDTGINLGLGCDIYKTSIELRLNQSIINFDKIDKNKYHQTLSLGVTFHLLK